MCYGHSISSPSLTLPANTTPGVMTLPRISDQSAGEANCPRSFSLRHPRGVWILVSSAPLSAYRCGPMMYSCCLNSLHHFRFVVIITRLAPIFCLLVTVGITGMIRDQCMYSCSLLSPVSTVLLQVLQSEAAIFMPAHSTV